MLPNGLLVGAGAGCDEDPNAACAPNGFEPLVAFKPPAPGALLPLVDGAPNVVEPKLPPPAGGLLPLVAGAPNVVEPKLPPPVGASLLLVVPDGAPNVVEPKAPPPPPPAGGLVATGLPKADAADDPNEKLDGCTGGRNDVFAFVAAFVSNPPPVAAGC